MIDQKTLKYFLRYNPDTGVFRWNRAPSRPVYSHAIAGHINSDGYRLIRIVGTLYRSARLVHLYMTGRWPDPEIDHINRNRNDDRWSNLREVTHLENQRNKSAAGRVPYLGVSTKGDKFRAQICRNGRIKYLGTFDTAEQAAAAYREAANL